MGTNRTKNIIAIALSFILALFAGDKIQAINVASKAIEIVLTSETSQVESKVDEVIETEE
jgi:hypothetical protein